MKKQSAKKSAKLAVRSPQGYGWIPDLPDHRDQLFGLARPSAPILPKLIDWRSLCPPVVDQGQLGSCTANALAGALGFLENKDGISFEAASRLFIYYNERAVEGTVKTDSGAMIRDGIKTLAAEGVCPENEWPYVITRFTTKPSPTCYKDAVAHKITLYQRLQSLNEMRACLAGGFPFVFGITVYDSFESAGVARTGAVPLPSSRESTLGGHAIVAVGYDDRSKRFIFRNSWGASWGMAGYGTIPYDYLADRNLSDDFWTVRRGEGF